MNIIQQLNKLLFSIDQGIQALRSPKNSYSQNYNQLGFSSQNTFDGFKARVFLYQKTIFCYRNRKYSMAELHSIFHKYWVYRKPINPQRTNFYGNLSFSKGESMSGSSIYKCRKITKDLENDNSNFYAMKVIPYKKDKKSIKSVYKQQAKLYYQIQTQYNVLTILRKCHRIAKVIEIINENTKRKDDKEFFHDFLGKPETPDQNYICFVTEYCNQGNLDAIIEKKKGGLTEDQVVTYGAQIIEGLIELKKKKIIHRDLRLCNILVHNGQIKFSDFDTAFIGGVSTYLDVKNGIDNNTAPPQIINLSSMANQQLKKFDSDKLYHLQQKSDIYFFGLALYKMIFGSDCFQMTEQNLINEINSKIVNQKFNKQLLQIMKQCLEENSQKRMDLVTLVQAFCEIEKTKYYEERSIQKLYLSETPNIFVLNQVLESEAEFVAKIDDRFMSITNHKNDELNFEKQLKRSTESHETSIYKKRLQHQNIPDLNELWKKKTKEKKEEQQRFVANMQQFIKNVSIRSFYYEFLYSVILSINMRSIKIKSMNHLIRASKTKVEKEITHVLTFLFELLLEQPFKEDKYYNKENLTYEARKLFQTLIRSDIIQNKKDCYVGKASQFQDEKTRIQKRKNKFYEKQYKNRQNFEQIYKSYQKIMKEIDLQLKTLLKDTIIKLGFAYENADKTREIGNIKQILFILIVLEQQNINALRKNQIIVLWKLFDPILNEEVELDRSQVQVFIRQHKKVNPEIETQANLDKNIVSATFFSIDQSKVMEEVQQEVKGEARVSLNVNQLNASNSLEEPMKISVSEISHKNTSSNNIGDTDKFELALNKSSVLGEKDQIVNQEKGMIQN